MARQHRPSDQRRLRTMTALACALVIVAPACDATSTPSTEAEAQVEAGRVLFTTEGCVRCHGAEGQGIVGPRLNQGSVLRTFPRCGDQLRWVSLGSAGWERDVGPSYGATAKPVQGGMPTFGSRLSEDQLTQVVTYTRTVFGGANAEDVVADCG